VAALAEGTDAADLVAPPDSAGRERVEQHLAQLAALHLGASTRAVVGFVQQDRPVPVEDPHRLAPLQDETPELIHQGRRLQGQLAVVIVDVEHPALRPRRRGGLRLADRRRDAVDMEDPGKRQPAEARTDDRDRGMHPDPSLA
jgi:hypothetical protein